MAMDAFDLAERFQTLVFVMSDLDLGDEHLDVAAVHVSGAGRSIAARCSTPRRWRGSASGAATRTSTATAFRTARFPGTGMPAYFTRGSGHNEKGAVQRAARRLRQEHRPAGAQVRDRAAARAAARVVDDADGAEIGIIAFGTSHWAIEESRDQLGARVGHADRLPAAARLSVHRRARRRSSTATTASTSSSRTATRRC